MTSRRLGKYIEDLIAGRRPEPFEADEFEAAQIRTAIDLQAARAGADQPRPEFVDELQQRIAAQVRDQQGGPSDAHDAGEQPRHLSPTRRQVVLAGTAAASAAVAAVAVDRVMIGETKPAVTQNAEQATTLAPNDGSWQEVARSSELVEGDVLSFDLGSVNGFLRRVGDHVEAVSGVCTHQGCRLWFDQPADRLRCPCHVTSFSPAGQVLTHQLPIAPKPLPRLEVRERAGIIEVLAPTHST